MSYSDFISGKRTIAAPCGIPSPPELHASLFPFQSAITRWALQRGKAAIWADCGLGKSRMALEWSRVAADTTVSPVLILTPLAVAQQFIREGDALGLSVRLIREAADVADEGIHVCNYDRLHKLDPSMFGAVVLDESSVLKDYTSSTRNELVSAFARTPMRLCCSATPAPNDHIELGNHAEFLGTMSRVEMLAHYFVHDGGETQKWRLKGHARSDFWRWVASWAVNLRKPSDLGFSDEGYDLPELRITHHVVDVDTSAMAREQGLLFADDARTLADQRAARKASLTDRVRLAADMANASGDPWLIWCDLNDESTALAKAIPDAVEVRGSDDADTKEARMFGFATGAHRVIVTKPSIAGFGVNWQHCAHVAFVGVTHSFEAWYQAIRRTWRFGQTREVHCHVITSAQEGAVVENLQRKQRDADAMGAAMVEHMAELNRESLGATERTIERYEAREDMRTPAWLVSEVAA